MKHKEKPLQKWTIAAGAAGDLRPIASIRACCLHCAANEYAKSKFGSDAFALPVCYVGASIFETAFDALRPVPKGHRWTRQPFQVLPGGDHV